MTSLRDFSLKSGRPHLFYNTCVPPVHLWKSLVSKLKLQYFSSALSLAFALPATTEKVARQETALNCDLEYFQRFIVQVSLIDFRSNVSASTSSVAQILQTERSLSTHSVFTWFIWALSITSRPKPNSLMILSMESSIVIQSFFAHHLCITKVIITFSRNAL